MPAVVRRRVEYRLLELVLAAVAGDPDVAHADAAPGRFPGRLADARRPAHLRPAGPELVAERAALGFVFEQRNGHLNDHARTSRYASMITAARSEPGPGSVGPGTSICTGCADGSGRGQGKHRMGLGNSGPCARNSLVNCGVVRQERMSSTSSTGTEFSRLRDVPKRDRWLIRGNGRTVQNRPALITCWADVPGLSSSVDGWLQPWQQRWQSQSTRLQSW